jgi:hypothetical protein
VTAILVFVLAGPTVSGQAPRGTPAGGGDRPGRDAGSDQPGQVIDTDKPPDITDQEGRIRISRDDACWIDRRQKQIVVEGTVCLREGFLEMFACRKGTKEHESVVAMDSKAYVIHAALLALGAKPGSPVKFHPRYQPASGTKVAVFVEWRGADGREQRVPAQQWVRQVSTRQAMPHDWVFAGSSFWTDPADGKQYYRAEGGDVICVSNFPTAMLDVPVESTQANDELLFEAFTENIPPRGTRVRVILVPRLTSEKPD